MMILVTVAYLAIMYAVIGSTSAAIGEKWTVGIMMTLGFFISLNMYIKDGRK